MLTLSQEWFAFESTTAHRPLVTRGRLLLENFMQSGEYPVRIEINWKYTPDKTGMPPKDEADQIDLIIGYLSEAMEKDRLAVLSALHTGAGQSVSVYYTRDPEAFSRRLDRVLGVFPPLPLTIGAADDKEWNAYRQLKEQAGL